MLAVLALLVVSSCVRLVIAFRNPKKDYTELRQRIQSWWIMIGLLFAVLLVGRTSAIVFFAILSFLALKEFFSIVPLRESDRRVIFWAYLAIPVQYYWISREWYGMFIIFIPVYMFLFLPLRMVMIGETKGMIKSMGTIHWGLMLTVFCISHIACLLTLPNTNEAAGEMGLILFLVFTTQFNDVCQYIWGKSLGRHKIVPKVSPNKTWEGFIGGVISIAICSGFAAPYLTPLTFQQGMLTGAAIAIAGFSGDVVLSAVKRDLRIKDSSTLIPGHGGLLDRMDSLIFTAPLFFHLMNYLYA